MPKLTAEERRLAEDGQRKKNWKRWGPYLSERQWGTVREDYSPYGSCWDYFPHEHARSRAYRWGEDGLLGISDRECRLCFALALWNGRDPILKERLFGLTGPEGNHGEDVKECYYYLDSTPTHSYMKALYKYPQSEFPYARLLEANRRGRHEPEFELADSGVFDGDRYFDVLAEFAKGSPNDIAIRLTISNRAAEPAAIDVLPTLWFRNTWSWGCTHEGCELKPRIDLGAGGMLIAQHRTLGEFHCSAGPAVPHGRAAARRAAGSAPTGADHPRVLFTDNETNVELLFGFPGRRRGYKDAFHDFVIHGRGDALRDVSNGTKAAFHYHLELPAHGQTVIRLRLSASDEAAREPLGPSLDRVLDRRQREADQFYHAHIPAACTADQHLVARQAYAGLLWTKQFYHYVVKDWLDGDPAQPQPPAARKHGRNWDWPHLFNRDVISMPDKWEYPWYAAWDLAFHMIPMAKIDPQFAKDQLVLFLREWYMHPNGQIPAYEFALGDVNPPVHAWACWRVYKMTGPRGHRDLLFLKRTFQKLLLNFTWWVNRKDLDGNNLFAGGFLGLDNIGIFDRSKPLPTGGHIEQADGTAWMAFYCGTMLSMALELAEHDSSYEDLASKFFEHFVAISDAMNSLGGTGLWDETDGFYYDQLHVHGTTTPMRVRSMVGLLPLIAVEVLEQEIIDKLPGFAKRMRWFLEHRPDLARQISYMERDAQDGVAHRLLAIPSRERLERVLRYMLDEHEFLSPYGLRSLSRVHKDRPYTMQVNGETHFVDYVPAESTTGLFGGNSNWRGPIWFPVNFLIIEALERYHHFYGDELRVECPVGSGRRLTLREVAEDLNARLTRLFLRGGDGRRPCHGDDPRYHSDPHWRELVLFHEYFHGDTGRGAGASHQTGWTALVTRCMDR